MIGVELVSDPGTKAPFPRSGRVAERVVAAAREAGLLLYSSTGHVEGDGDLVMLGPPFVITDEECDLVVERITSAIASVE
jgi:adenosylmethionine-8-amino-7-oxononanoate aminotransferase